MRGYRLIDYLTQGYIALVAAIILVFHDQTLPMWPLYFAAHVGAMVGIHVLVKLSTRHRNRILDLLRCFYPIILYTVFYCETHRLDSLVYPGYLDSYFIGLDQRIFGCQLSRTLMQQLPHLWVSEVLHLAYFTYYVMVLGVGLALYCKDRRHFFHYLTTVSLIFYVCYLTYIFFPVMGPHGNWVREAPTAVRILIGERQVPETLRSGPFFLVMQMVYKFVEPAGGAAFPSSHVAVAVAALCFTWRYWRKIRWLHLIDVLLLCVSTVYCGYHYVVDVIAGILTAAVLVAVGDLMYRKAQRKDEF